MDLVLIGIGILLLIIVATLLYYFWNRSVYNSFNSSVSKTSTKSKNNKLLNLEILKLEFEYAKATSIQAQQDRLTILNFYLGLFAAISSISIGVQSLDTENFKEYGAYSFFVLSIIGFFFNLQIIRLRQAWVGSPKVMSQIKQYFLDLDFELYNYLHWTLNSLPKPQRLNTLNFFSVLIVTILSTLAILLGSLILELPIIFFILICTAYFLINLALYHTMLKYNL